MGRLWHQQEGCDQLVCGSTHCTACLPPSCCSCPPPRSGSTPVVLPCCLAERRAAYKMLRETITYGAKALGVWKLWAGDVATAVATREAVHELQGQLGQSTDQLQDGIDALSLQAVGAAQQLQHVVHGQEAAEEASTERHEQLQLLGRLDSLEAQLLGRLDSLEAQLAGQGGCTVAFAAAVHDAVMDAHVAAQVEEGRRRVEEAEARLRAEQARLAAAEQQRLRHAAARAAAGGGEKRAAPASRGPTPPASPTAAFRVYNNPLGVSG